MAMRTLDTHDLAGTRVYVQRPRKAEPDAVRKLGRVHACVFHPTENRCVGLLVKRPDAALMFHRADAFVALDGFEVTSGGLLVADEPAAMGPAAEKALGASLDDCVIWVGLPLVSADGTVLGTVGRVRFDACTGAVESVTVTQGMAASALLGQRVLPAEDILGFLNVSGAQAPGAILVSDEALEKATTGGAAEAIGKSAAVVAAKARKAASTAKPKAHEAASQAGDVVGKAAFAAGRQFGRASGMFAAFKDEFDKARNDDDED